MGLENPGKVLEFYLHQRVDILAFIVQTVLVFEHKTFGRALTDSFQMSP
jgi:hypothetical protein